MLLIRSFLHPTTRKHADEGLKSCINLCQSLVVSPRGSRRCAHNAGWQSCRGLWSPAGWFVRLGNSGREKTIWLLPIRAPPPRRFKRVGADVSQGRNFHAVSVYACLRVSQGKVSASVWDVKPGQVRPRSKFRWLPVGSGLVNRPGNYLRLLGWNISQIPSGSCGKSTCRRASAAAGEVTRCWEIILIQLNYTRDLKRKILPELMLYIWLMFHCCRIIRLWPQFYFWEV